AEIDVIHIHLAVDQCLAAFEMVYHDKAGAVEVTDFYGRDETLAHLSFACAEMLSARTAGNAKPVAAFAHLLAIHIAEKYTNIEIVQNIAEAIGAKPSQVALAWLLGKGDFIVPIPGTKRRAYLQENAGAVDVKLSDDNMARLEAALRPEAVSGPRYNEKLIAWVDR